MKFWPSTSAKELLFYQAARLGLGTLDADTIKNTILDLMNQGFYADECLDVLDTRAHPRMEDVLPAFKVALNSHGLTLPDRETAVGQLIAYRVRRMAEGEMDALMELWLLIEDVYYQYDFHASVTGFLGDSHDIERLAGIYWGNEDLIAGSLDALSAGSDNEKARVVLANQVRAEAHRWLEKHP